MEESLKGKRRIDKYGIKELNKEESSFYHGQVSLQRHKEIQLPGSSEPLHVMRQKEGLLEGLGEIRRLPSLGLPKSCVPRNRGAIQL